MCCGKQAHDLKTPLHSITAEISHLRAVFTRAIVDSKEATKPLVSSSDEIAATFGSLDSTIEFLIVTINRAQDYVKSSRGIQLTPTLGTFYIPDIVNFARRCIDAQQSGRIITVHPLVRIHST
jgi:hypothetical protein